MSPLGRCSTAPDFLTSWLHRAMRAISPNLDLNHQRSRHRNLPSECQPHKDTQNDASEPSRHSADVSTPELRGRCLTDTGQVFEQQRNADALCGLRGKAAEGEQRQSALERLLRVFSSHPHAVLFSHIVLSLSCSWHCLTPLPRVCCLSQIASDPLWCRRVSMRWRALLNTSKCFRTKSD